MTADKEAAMYIHEIMTKQVITVEMDDDLSIVKDIFDNAKIHHLLVVEDGELMGVVSDRDLYRSISPNIGTCRYTPRDLETLNKRIHMVMTRHPKTLPETATIREAVELFSSNNFSCIPIVDDANHIRGIITWRDIFKHFDQVVRHYGV